MAIAAAAPCTAATQQPAMAASAPAPAPGDVWVYRTLDLFTGIESQRYAATFLRREALDLKFSSIDQRSGRMHPFSLTFDLGGCSSATSLVKPSCAGPYAFPIKVGDQHSYDRLPFRDGYSGQTCTVDAIEKVVVPAGTFDAFRVVCAGRWTYTGGSDAIYQGRLAEEHWYAPSVNNEVKVIRRAYANKGGLDSQAQTELMRFTPAGSEGAAPEASILAATPSPSVDVMPAEFTAGTTRFVGRFAKSPGNVGYTGDGKVTWANGDVYEGHVEGGVREGQGRFAWSNGQRYDGEWRRDQPQGKGTLRFVNGDVYEGEVEAGTPLGEGAMVYGSGDRYAGRFAAGVPEGVGIYTWASGQSLRGRWVAGHAEGEAALQFANGDRYEGELASGVPSGRGRIAYRSGDAYAGTFRAGVAEGEGTYTWRDGGQYVGQWKAGLKQGRGVITWANGDRWEGAFDNDRQGEGTLTRKAN